MCKADPHTPGVNYNKPHVPVEGKDFGDLIPIVYAAGQTGGGYGRMSCLYCGKWMDDEDKFSKGEGETVAARDQE